MKVSTRTDATAHEFVVRRHGRRMPDEAAAGLDFPFRSPERPGVTHSMAFVRGLETPIAPYTAPPSWYASDNGFSSTMAMDEAHRPIVELAHTSIGETGTVLDLGCGNGALLKKICEPRPSLIPFGVDLDETKLEHARQLQPSFAANFVAGSMFEGIPLDGDTVYSLVLLMPGRLLEVDEASGRAAEIVVAGTLSTSAGLCVRRMAHETRRTRGPDLEGRADARVATLERSGGARADPNSQFLMSLSKNDR